MTPIERCIRALGRVGCAVTPVGTESRPDAYRVLLPPEGEHDAPDGTEVTFSAARFALICKKVLLERVERCQAKN